MKPILSILEQIISSSIFAFQALVANKMRTFLSTLGITIGIFSIILILSIVDSLEKNVKKSIDSLGKDAIIVDKWPWDFSGEYKWWKFVNRPNPALNELKLIQQKSNLAAASCFVLNVNNATVENGKYNANNVNVQGISYQYYFVKNFNIAQGRYFTEAEINNGTNAVIIGDNIKTNLFPDGNAIGKTITVKKLKYQVIGVIEKQGESIFGSQFDDLLLAPVYTMAQHVRLNSSYNNATIEVKAKPGITPNQLEEELRVIMRIARKLKPGQEDNFALNKTSLFDAPIKATFKTISIAGWIIGGFSMLVGAFGIANIMFVSVKERTNQIGIKKSLGARNVYILIEFLTEAVVLCLAGGAIGLGAVSGIVFLSGYFNFEIVLSIKNILIGFLTSAGVGILAGIIPAWSASQLDPVAAMRAK